MRATIRTCAPVLLLLALPACTSGPEKIFEPAIPVPPGTAIFDYAETPLQERTQQIELVEDLRIGDGGADPNYFLGRHGPKVAADREGRIYAFDSDEFRIQVFSDEGEYLRTIGRRGQGPGEFGVSGFLTVAGDVVALTQGGMDGGIAWTLEGQYLRDLRTSGPPARSTGVGLADGTFVSRYGIRKMQGDTVVVVRNDATGSEMHRYLEVSDTAQVGYAADPTGAIYVSTIQGGIQQITAFTPSGDIRWAILTPRTGSAPVSLRMGPGGGLYVFSSCGSDPAVLARCVDVYSREGVLRTNAWIDDVDLDVGWQVADEEFVYGASYDVDEDQWWIVRYRVELQRS